MAISCPRHTAWKNVSFQIAKVFSIVYLFPFLWTQISARVAFSASRQGLGAAPGLPDAVLVSMEDGSRRNFIMIPSLLKEESFHVTWSADSSKSPPDMVTALRAWDSFLRSGHDHFENNFPSIQLSAANESLWCLNLPPGMPLGTNGQKICRKGTLDGTYQQDGAVLASAVVLAKGSAPGLAPFPNSMTNQDSSESTAGFRKNPNKPKPNMASRLHPLLAQSGFAVLAFLQIYLFFVYWNGGVSPVVVGKTFASMWLEGQVWRAFSGSTAHFDLWHIGLNLSAFYRLSEALQTSYDESPVLFLGLNLSFMVWVSVLWLIWQYGVHQQLQLQQQRSDNSVTLPSTPTVGYSGVLFALSTMVILRQSQSCPIPFLDSICFSTFSFWGFPMSLAPFVQLGMVQLILQRVSFAGHLAGIFVGHLSAWNMLPWSMYPCIVWSFWHLVYLWGVAPMIGERRTGRRLADATTWVTNAWSSSEVQVIMGVWMFSGFALGWRSALFWSYSLLAVFWMHSVTSIESMALTWKRAFCVHAIVLSITHAVTLGTWALLPSVWFTTSGFVSVLLQGFTIWNGLFRSIVDVQSDGAAGIFFHTVGRTILQPLQQILSNWQSSSNESQTRVNAFPGEGRRLRAVEAESV